MRVVIAATLLFFNVAMALWMLYGRAPAVAREPVPANQPGVASLVLLSERGAQGEPGAASVLSKPTTPAGDQQPKTQSAPPSGDGAAVAAAPATRLPGLPGGRDAGQGALSAQPEPGVDPDTRDPAELACRMIGPYLDEAAARAAAAAVSSAGGQTEISQDRLVDSRYWVFLPPFVSRSAAFEGERELRSQGIDDMQVLTGDAKENGISLGLYRDRASADRRVAQLRGLGYAPRVEVVERSRPQYWVEVRGPMDGDGQQSLPRLVQQDPLLRLRDCDDPLAQ